jgi:hypothetical protein
VKGVSCGLVNKANLVHNFSWYVYFFSLHVLGDFVPIIRRNNCISASLGICHSLWMTVWYAGWNECQFWINLNFLSGVFLLRLMKTFINFRQDNWSLGQYLNWGSPRREAAVLTIPQYLLELTVIGWIPICRFDVLKQCWWRYESSGIGRHVDL